MSNGQGRFPQTGQTGIKAILPWLAAAAAFLLLFGETLIGTVRLWLTDADTGHGLLLVPVALWLAWRSRLTARSRPQPVLGSLILVAAVIVRYLSGLAAEQFTMRLSAVGAVFGVVVFAWGMARLLDWWLPAMLVVLAMPLPDVLTGTLALPLQLRASAMGAALLEWRHVPTQLAGNVIHLPGHSLFVTEACAGLRSLSALLALGLLIGGLWLKTWWARTLLVLTAIPIAMVLNSLRIFLTGFAVFFIDPRLGQGLMHYSEGWGIFVAAFAVLWVMSRLLGVSEAAVLKRST